MQHEDESNHFFKWRTGPQGTIRPCILCAISFQVRSVWEMSESEGGRMSQTIRVNEFPPTLNELNNMHFMKRAKLKEVWEAIVGKACLEHGASPMDKVSITLEFYFPDKRRRDPDNYGFSAKFLLDGLVKAGVLTDDSFDEVVELRIVKGGISKPKHILIHMQELSA